MGLLAVMAADAAPRRSVGGCFDFPTSPFGPSNFDDRDWDDCTPEPVSAAKCADKLVGVKTGSTAPTFSLQRLANHSTVSLADLLRQKPVFLELGEFT